MANFLTQAAGDFWDILRKKLPESFGLQWDLTGSSPGIEPSEMAAGLARKAINAYSDLPSASSQDISRQVQGRVALSGIGPGPNNTADQSAPITRIAQANIPATLSSRAAGDLVPSAANQSPPTTFNNFVPEVNAIGKADQSTLNNMGRSAEPLSVEETVRRFAANNPMTKVNFNGNDLKTPAVDLTQSPARAFSENPTGGINSTSTFAGTLTPEGRRPIEIFNPPQKTSPDQNVSSLNEDLSAIASLARKMIESGSIYSQPERFIGAMKALEGINKAAYGSGEITGKYGTTPSPFGSKVEEEKARGAAGKARQELANKGSLDITKQQGENAKALEETKSKFITVPGGSQIYKNGELVGTNENPSKEELKKNPMQEVAVKEIEQINKTLTEGILLDDNQRKNLEAQRARLIQGLSESVNKKKNVPQENLKPGEQIAINPKTKKRVVVDKNGVIVREL